MIGYLKGKPIISEQESILVDVQGVGYEVYVSASAKSKLSSKEVVELYIYTNVKQDGLELYGFIESKELYIFKLLLGVSGVGPKIALAILDNGVDSIIHAVTNADVGFFTAIPKVGKKNAQKIIIELKTKLGSLADLDLTDEEGGETNEVIQTLISMGFSRKEVVLSIQKIPKNVTKIEDKIRYCLKELGR